MTDLRETITRLRELMGKATPEPWYIDVCNNGEKCWCRTISTVPGSDKLEHAVICDGCIPAREAELFVNLVNAAPALLDAAEVVANADQEPGLVARYCQQVREIADLRAQLAAMTAKLEIRDPSELDEYITESQRDWDELQAKLAASQARVETLEVALRKYGQHRFACEFNRWDTFGQGKCSCGLKQALAGAGGDK